MKTTLTLPAYEATAPLIPEVDDNGTVIAVRLGNLDPALMADLQAYADEAMRDEEREREHRAQRYVAIFGVEA